MSIALFVNGYLAVVAVEHVAIQEYMMVHLQELMEDAEQYGWRVIREFHAAWLQLLEQGRAAWGDNIKKEKLRRLYSNTVKSLSESAQKYHNLQTMSVFS